MISNLQKILIDKQRRLKEEGLPSGNLSLVKILLLGFLENITAAWYFRNATHKGSMVLAKKKPIVEIYGNLEIGHRVKFWSKFEKCKIFIKSGASLIIGDDSFINGVHISSSTRIQIGKNVHIGPYTIIMDNDFHTTSEGNSEKMKAEIIIEDNVWIAMRCMIMKGVTVGEGSVVAAGAIVTKDVPPRTVVGGIPAKVLKQLN